MLVCTKPINIMSGTIFFFYNSFCSFFWFYFYANVHSERVVSDVLDSAAGKRYASDEIVFWFIIL